MLKAAIIGCGHRGQEHAAAYRHLPEATLVGVCDRSAERATSLAEAYSARAYTGVEDLTRSERPDIVHLATQPTERVELMTLVAGLGVPLCTVEKPIATGVADWRALRALAARTTTKFAVCHQFRWHPNLTRCRDAANADRIGSPRLLEMSAGMNILGQGTHCLNYGRSLIGDARVTQVFGNVEGWDTSDRHHPGPVSTEAFLEFENGATGIWVTGPIAPRVSGGSDEPWQHLRVALHGSHGAVAYEEFGAWEIVSAQSGESGDFGGMDTWRHNNELSQAAFHRAMFAWRDDDRLAPGTNLDASLHEWSVVLALFESALSHAAVAIEGFDPADDLVDRVARLGESKT